MENAHKKIQAVRDRSHDEAIERWAKYMQDHPRTWKREHTRFIDSQFMHHRTVMKRLLKQKDGKDIIKELYGIKNPKAYPALFR